MKKPLIGIAADKPRRIPKYVRSIEKAGGEVEILYPDSYSPEVLEHLDGLLLTGGGDIDAAEFSEENHPKNHTINPKRDAMELSLTRAALSQNIPVFGICRGLQVMNVAMGGNLHQDIPGHDDEKNSRQNVAHDVTIREGTKLHEIIGKEKIGVNSFHHQAAKDLGKGLIATATSQDGFVEGIENPNAKYFLGVQWHPEEFVDQQTDFHELFDSFINAAREHQAHHRVTEGTGKKSNS
jgi:putative glutamine amidotransferase